MSIIKNFRLRLSEAWYQLSEAERESLLNKVNAARDQAGGTILFSGESGWASEEWQFFGAEEFPDVEAVQKHTKLLSDLDWFRYIESESLVGTRTD